MKRQKITIGSVLEINIENQYYVYAQILTKSECVFFNFRSEITISDLKLLDNSEVLFYLAIYNDVITKGKWLKVGKLPVRDNFKILPLNFIQDIQNTDNFELYNPNTGEIVKATREKCEGLEYAAVWEANHVEDRIRDYYLGVSNVWVEQLKIK